MERWTMHYMFAILQKNIWFIYWKIGGKVFSTKLIKTHVSQLQSDLLDSKGDPITVYPGNKDNLAWGGKSVQRSV